MVSLLNMNILNKIERGVEVEIPKTPLWVYLDMTFWLQGQFDDLIY